MIHVDQNEYFTESPFWSVYLATFISLQTLSSHKIQSYLSTYCTETNTIFLSVHTISAQDLNTNQTQTIMALQSKACNA